MFSDSNHCLYEWYIYVKVYVFEPATPFLCLYQRTIVDNLLIRISRTHAIFRGHTVALVYFISYFALEKHYLSRLVTAFTKRDSIYTCILIVLLLFQHNGINS